MELLVCVVNDTSKLHDVITALVEAGITGATVVETQGMGRILSRDIPIFAGFRHMLAGSRPFNHMIFSVVEDPEACEEALRIMRDVLLDGTDTPHGVAFTVPVGRFEKFREPA